MLFSTREDIGVPIEKVYQALTDFESIEREALRRGAEVSRVGSHAEKGVGQGWTILFVYRGRARKLKTEITEFDPPNSLVAAGKVGGLEGELSFDLVSLSPRLTRVMVDAKLNPTTLSSRLFVQSLKLARSNLNNRFKNNVAHLARKFEERLG